MTTIGIPGLDVCKLITPEEHEDLRFDCVKFAYNESEGLQAS